MSVYRTIGPLVFHCLFMILLFVCPRVLALTCLGNSHLICTPKKSHNNECILMTIKSIRVPQSIIYRFSINKNKKVEIL